MSTSWTNRIKKCLFLSKKPTKNVIYEGDDGVAKNCTIWKGKKKKNEEERSLVGIIP